jgi:hypothetical protein
LEEIIFVVSVDCDVGVVFVDAAAEDVDVEDVATEDVDVEDDEGDDE